MSDDVRDPNPNRAEIKIKIKQFEVDVEPVEDRRVRFTITTANPDRERDIVDPLGVETENFEKNPVVLFGHKYWALPIGRAIQLERQAEKIVATVEFATADLNPEADQVFKMVKAGFLKAASIGFRPLEWVFNEERRGIDFKRVELLEFSIVPVPANAEALVAASADGSAYAKLLRGWVDDVNEALGADPLLRSAEEKKLTEGESEGKSEVELKSDELKSDKSAFEEKSTDAAAPKMDDSTDKDVSRDFESGVRAIVDEAVKVAVDPLKAEVETLQKSGRALSKANEGLIREAKEAIQRATDQLTTVLRAVSDDDDSADDDEKSTLPEKLEEKPEAKGVDPSATSDEFILELMDANEGDDSEKSDSVGTVELTEDVIAAAVRDGLQSVVGSVVSSEVAEAVRSLSGRV